MHFLPLFLISLISFSTLASASSAPNTTIVFTLSEVTTVTSVSQGPSTSTVTITDASSSTILSFVTVTATTTAVSVVTSVVTSTTEIPLPASSVASITLSETTSVTQAPTETSDADLAARCEAFKAKCRDVSCAFRSFRATCDPSGVWSCVCGAKVIGIGGSGSDGMSGRMGWMMGVATSMALMGVSAWLARM